MLAAVLSWSEFRPAAWAYTQHKQLYVLVRTHAHTHTHTHTHTHIHTHTHTHKACPHLERLLQRHSLGVGGRELQVSTGVPRLGARDGGPPPAFPCPCICGQVRCVCVCVCVCVLTCV